VSATTICITNTITQHTQASQRPLARIEVQKRCLLANAEARWMDLLCHSGYSICHLALDIDADPDLDAKVKVFDPWPGLTMIRPALHPRGP
jgi:hypothetical protein